MTNLKLTSTTAYYLNDTFPTLAAPADMAPPLGSAFRIQIEVHD